jgi:hypothetical protein
LELELELEPKLELELEPKLELELEPELELELEPELEPELELAFARKTGVFATKVDIKDMNKAVGLAQPALVSAKLPPPARY